jgi:hypothetical protein
MIAQRLKHKIMTPSWRIPKQEIKHSDMRNLVAVILITSISCKWRGKQKLQLTIPKHQLCCQTGNFWNISIRPKHSESLHTEHSGLLHHSTSGSWYCDVTCWMYIREKVVWS